MLILRYKPRQSEDIHDLTEPSLHTTTEHVCEQRLRVRPMCDLKTTDSSHVHSPGPRPFVLSLAVYRWQAVRDSHACERGVTEPGGPRDRTSQPRPTALRLYWPYCEDLIATAQVSAAAPRGA